MGEWQLEIHDSGKIVVERLHVADRFWSRFRGLQFRRVFPQGHGILLAPCNSIHTMWMRFAIDVAMLDRKGEVLAVRQAVLPWRLVFARAARMPYWRHPAGTLSLAAGDRLVLRSRQGRSSAPAAAGRLSRGVMRDTTVRVRGANRGRNGGLRTGSNPRKRVLPL